MDEILVGLATLGHSKDEAREFDLKREKQFDKIIYELIRRKRQGMRFWQALSTLLGESNKEATTVVIRINNQIHDPYSWEGLVHRDFDLIDQTGYGIYLDHKPSYWTDSYDKAIEAIKSLHLTKEYLEIKPISKKNYEKSKNV